MADQKTSCSNCDQLYQQNDIYYCQNGSKLETLKERPSWCPKESNCHNYCRYGKQCRYKKGENGINPEDCAMYYKIEDLLREADDIKREQQEEEDDDAFD